MKNKTGFTLLEVLVVVGILSIFLLSAVTISIVSIRNLKNSETKILATRYGEGLIEWLRGEKDVNWNTFITKVGVWCFKDEPITQWPQSGGCGQNQKIKNLFEREVIVDYNGALDQIIVKVSVSWDEGNQTVNIPITTILEKYD